MTGAALFPLAAAGFDVVDLVAGASDMAERCRADGEGFSPAALMATGLLAGDGAPEIVTTSTALHDLAAWVARRGAAIARSGGHRLAIVLTVDGAVQEVEIPKAYQDVDGIGYLGGQGLVALTSHQESADEIARWSAGQPTLALRCPARSASVVGQLVYLTEAANALARAARGAETAEPAGAARLAFGLAGRPGYEAERAEVQRAAGRREARYVV